MMPIVSTEVFGNVLRRLDRIICWYVAVPAHSASNIITFAPMMHNEIDWVFALRVNELLFGSLSSAFVDSVVSIVDWFIWPVY